MPYQSLIKAWLADDVNDSRRALGANAKRAAAQVRPLTVVSYVMVAQSGSPSNFGNFPNSPSQAALLDEKMCAVGNIEILVSKHPAGTTSKPAI